MEVNNILQGLTENDFVTHSKINACFVILLLVHSISKNNVKYS